LVRKGIQEEICEILERELPKRKALELSEEILGVLEKELNRRTVVLAARLSERIYKKLAKES